jgi:hypothetical protein
VGPSTEHQHVTGIANNSDFFDYSMFRNASAFTPGGALFGTVTSVEGFYFVPNVPQFRDSTIGGPHGSATILTLNIAEDEDYDAFTNRFMP